MMSSTLSVCEYISRAMQSKTSSNTYSTAAKYRFIFVEQVDEGVSPQCNPDLSAYLIKIVLHQLQCTGCIKWVTKEETEKRRGLPFSPFITKNIHQCLQSPTQGVLCPLRCGPSNPHLYPHYSHHRGTHRSC